MKLSALTLTAAASAALALRPRRGRLGRRPGRRSSKAAGFGFVLARADRQALYYWQVEKRPAGRCAAPAPAPRSGRR